MMANITCPLLIIAIPPSHYDNIMSLILPIIAIGCTTSSITCPCPLISIFSTSLPLLYIYDGQHYLPLAHRL